VVDVFQAGAGTSFNMNVNEVLANRALEKGLLKPEELEKIFDPKRLLNQKK